jgi:hypothetical protein
MATPRLLTLRFEQHLPYYRIEQLYACAGVPLSRQPKPLGGAETASRMLPAGRRSREAAAEANPELLGGHGR